MFYQGTAMSVIWSSVQSRDEMLVSVECPFQTPTVPLFTVSRSTTRLSPRFMSRGKARKASGFFRPAFKRIDYMPNIHCIFDHPEVLA
jgi:hypothetical protein